jgi:hypothetical protein
VSGGRLARLLPLTARGPAHLERLLELERRDADEVLRIDFALLAAEYLGARVDLLDALLNRRQLSLLDEVGLVEEDAVGEGHLLDRLILHALGLLVVEARNNVLGIRHGDDAVEREFGLNVVVHEEGLRHRRRVGQSGGLNDHSVELCNLRVQVFERDHQISAHGAADAPVHHLDDLLVGLLRQNPFVHADLSELVLDDCEAEPMVGVLENVVEQSCLP